MKLLCFASPAILLSIFVIGFPDENEAAVRTDVLKIKKGKKAKDQGKHINLRMICVVKNQVRVLWISYTFLIKISQHEPLTPTNFIFHSTEEMRWACRGCAS